MTAAGIPDFREPREHLAYEANIIRSLGVNIHWERTLGKEIILDYLKNTYDSTLLAIGNWLPQDSRISNMENIQGVYNGIDYLEKISRHEKLFENKKVIIVGGGNTAIDCARTALRFGNSVTIVYRRTREEMPAEDYEIQDAIDEGVNIIFLAAPFEAVSENGKLTGIKCHKMRLGCKDA